MESKKHKQHQRLTCTVKGRLKTPKETDLECLGVAKSFIRDRREDMGSSLETWSVKIYTKRQKVTNKAEDRFTMPKKDMQCQKRTWKMVKTICCRLFLISQL